MTAAELFGVVVRLLGLQLVICGIVMAPPCPVFGESRLPGAAIVPYASTALLWLVGLWFLRGAKLLVRFAYSNVQLSALPAPE